MDICVIKIAIDGQDNPLTTDKDSKFYAVAKQIVLTLHLVDLNYLAFSKKIRDELTPDQQAIRPTADDLQVPLLRLTSSSSRCS